MDFVTIDHCGLERIRTADGTKPEKNKIIHNIKTLLTYVTDL